MEQKTLQPQELRIGNWVMYRKVDVTAGFKPFKVYAETFSDMEAGCIIVQGIPLTPDILEKTSPDKDLVDDGDNKRLAIGHMVGNMEYFLHLYDGTIWIDQHDTGYKFVHQYQNLYYMLSGKELEVTL